MKVEVEVPQHIFARVAQEVDADHAPAAIKRWLEAVCRNTLTNDIEAEYAEMAAVETAGLATHQNDEAWLAALWAETHGEDAPSYPHSDD